MVRLLHSVAGLFAKRPKSSYTAHSSCRVHVCYVHELAAEARNNGYACAGSTGSNISNVGPPVSNWKTTNRLSRYDRNARSNLITANKSKDWNKQRIHLFFQPTNSVDLLLNNHCYAVYFCSFIFLHENNISIVAFVRTLFPGCIWTPLFKEWLTSTDFDIAAEEITFVTVFYDVWDSFTAFCRTHLKEES